MTAQRLSVVLAMALFLPAAASQPEVELDVCAGIDEPCAEVPVEGAPVEAYAMNAEGVWAALSPVTGLVNAEAEAEDSTGTSALGHEVEVGVGASVDSSPPGPVADGRAHALPCADLASCPDLSVDLLELARDFRIRLETFRAGNCNIEEGSTQEGLRRVVRFTTTTPNHGTGHLMIGSAATNPGLFAWGACHGHDHFLDFAAYRLWTKAGYEEWRRARQAHPNQTASEVLSGTPGLADAFLAGHKQSFCLVDSKRYHETAASHFRHCGDQGLSRGWADVYIAALDGQFIDVTGVPAGWYVLEAEVNPERVFEERDYERNQAALLFFLPPS